MSESTSLFQPATDRAFASVAQARDGFAPQLLSREVGLVTNRSTGIATVSGLPNVGFEELTRFPSGLLGIAFNLDEGEIGVVLLGDYQPAMATPESGCSPANAACPALLRVDSCR
jgi:F-type H+-transporting ATPase subunit alpha